MFETGIAFFIFTVHWWWFDSHAHIYDAWFLSIPLALCLCSLICVFLFCYFFRISSVFGYIFWWCIIIINICAAYAEMHAEYWFVSHHRQLRQTPFAGLSAAVCCCGMFVHIWDVPHCEPETHAKKNSSYVCVSVILVYWIQIFWEFALKHENIFYCMRQTTRQQ